LGSGVKGRKLIGSPDLHNGPCASPRGRMRKALHAAMDQRIAKTRASRIRFAGPQPRSPPLSPVPGKLDVLT
jgi:hypothetical protein